MLDIKIELTKLTQEEAERGKVRAAYFMPYEQETESDRLARDILAPLAVAELMQQKGNDYQKNNARKIGEMFAECSAVCGSALWFCGSREEAAALTLANSYRVRAFGKLSPRSCFVLILENPKEKERAYLVRANW
jgi:hypothetical protein